MKPKKLYENVVIGNVLYGLGFAIRSRIQSGSVPSVVSMLQQTPDDKRLGDLLLEFPGVLRLIEFKSKDNRSSKERARHRRLSALLEGDAAQQAISKRVHWFVETAPSDDPKLAFTARIVPYLDAYPATKQRHSLEHFIETIADEALTLRSVAMVQEEKDYLYWVRRTLGEGEVGTGGLLLSADTSGTLHYVQLLDLLELRAPHREWVALHEARLELDLAYERKWELEHRRELSLSGPRYGR